MKMKRKKLHKELTAKGYKVYETTQGLAVTENLKQWAFVIEQGNNWHIWVPTKGTHIFQPRTTTFNWFKEKHEGKEFFETLKESLQPQVWAHKRGMIDNVGITIAQLNKIILN